MLSKLTEGVSEGQEYLIRSRGNQLRAQADRLSDFRDTYSPVLGISTAIDDGESKFHTIANSLFDIYLEYTDIKDGKIAREAAELLNEEPTVAGGEADHRADKKKFFSHIVGLVFRSLFQEQDFTQAGVLIAIGGTQAARDIEMNSTRQDAIKSGIKANARNLGKYKTVLNALGLGLHTLTPALPEPIRPTSKKVANLTLVAGTALSLAALIDMKLHVKRQKSLINQD